MILENMKKKISCPLGGASDLFTFFIIGNESGPRLFFFQLFLTFSESLGPWLYLCLKYSMYHNNKSVSPVMNDYVIF